MTDSSPQRSLAASLARVRSVTQATPAAGSQTVPSRPARRKTRVRTRFFRIVRRTHLYSGIFLVPLVLLYGVSAWLFNHPTHFSDRTTTEVAAPLESAEAELTELRDSDTLHQLAATIAAAYQPKAKKIGKKENASPPGAATRRAATRKIALAASPGIELRTRIVASRTSDKKSAFLTLDCEDETAQLRIREERRPTREAKRIERTKIDAIEGNVLIPKLANDRIERRVEDAFAAAGLADGRIRYRTMPSMDFNVVHDGRVERVRYDFQRSELRGLSGRHISTRRFLTGMHVAHGYPDSFNMRWIWALLVDVMALSMITWAISGLLMWWQMKSLRTIGFVLIAASVIASVLTFVGMHTSFTSP